MKIALISASLHPQSRSYVLARHCSDIASARGAEVDLIDLRSYALPLHTGTAECKTPEVSALTERVRAAAAVVVAAPIYVYDTNAAIKNFVDLTGRAWTDKPVGFLCAAGGQSSYMAIMGLANSLMLDFRCLIVPRFVYATGDDFAEDRQPDMHITSDEIKERIEQLTDAVFQLTRVLE
ncbi:MAG: NAD(P)H-dependent FMN reductase [Candidatus Latescibacterota bacterium]|jgi:NAD(P)H-dependent FMN reductase|tara:strand:- start:668 stop:1204 length:537 start_codon:yes stop_codon:yes gene_type:complete